MKSPQRSKNFCQLLWQDDESYFKKIFFFSFSMISEAFFFYTCNDMRTAGNLKRQMIQHFWAFWHFRLLTYIYVRSSLSILWSIYSRDLKDFWIFQKPYRKKSLISLFYYPSWIDTTLFKRSIRNLFFSDFKMSFQFWTSEWHLSELRKINHVNRQKNSNWIDSSDLRNRETTSKILWFMFEQLEFPLKKL